MPFLYAKIGDNTMARKELGNYIRHERMIRHITLQQVASACKVSITQISRVENGKENISLDIDMLATIAKVIQVPFEQILAVSGYLPNHSDSNIMRQIKHFIAQDSIQKYYDLDIDSLSDYEVDKIINQIHQTLLCIRFLVEIGSAIFDDIWYDVKEVKGYE